MNLTQGPITPERVVPARQLACRLANGIVLDGFAGIPVHFEGNFYWTRPGEGVVRCADHEFSDYEVAVAHQRIGNMLEMDEANRILSFGEDECPENDYQTRQVYMTLDGHELEPPECAYLPPTYFDGLAFGGIDKRAVGVYSLFDGLRWSESLPVRAVMQRHAISRFHQTIVLVDKARSFYSWDAYTGEVRFRKTAEELGIAELNVNALGQTAPLTGKVHIYDNLAIHGGVGAHMVAVDIFTGELCWCVDLGGGGRGSVVTEDGVVCAVTGGTYYELDACTGAIAKALPVPEPEDMDVLGIGAISADVTTTHYWGAADRGALYAVNRETGEIDWWWQDPEWGDAHFDVVVWDGALFAYGVSLDGKQRTYVFEPEGPAGAA